MALYHPRPERWPQFSLRGLLAVTAIAGVLAATVLPQAISAYQEWMRQKTDFDHLIDLIESTIAPDTWGNAPIVLPPLEGCLGSTGGASEPIAQHPNAAVEANSEDDPFSP